jgi:hypothetical protein
VAATAVPAFAIVVAVTVALTIATPGSQYVKWSLRWAGGVSGFVCAITDEEVRGLPR